MFLDIGLGVFIAIITSYFFQVDLSPTLLMFSIIFTLLPDSDFLYFYPKRHDTKYDHQHRNIIHFPLLYIPAGTLLIWSIWGNIWALSFFLASLGHFIHDSIGIGWGIKWLYPFSKNSYAFFYLYSRRIKKGLRRFIWNGYIYHYIKRIEWDFMCIRSSRERIVYNSTYFKRTNVQFIWLV